jgi:CRP/FNR family transcriptional regulator, cyclic AMP receptor protein
MEVECQPQKTIKNDFIFLDREKFQLRLQITPSLRRQLESTNDLKDVIQSKEKGQKKGHKRTLGEIFSVMNGVGQLSFAIMVAVQTTGWTPGSLELLRTEGLNIDSILADLESFTAHPIPVKTDSLLGLMAWEILELLIFPCLKVAYADGDFCEDEREMIIGLLSEQWGYHRPFVEKLIAVTEPKLGRFTYTQFAANIKEICRIFPEINYEESRNELIGVVKQIILADGVIHPNEQEELNSLIEFLAIDDKPQQRRLQINTFWDYIFKDESKDKDLRVTDILKRIPLFEHLSRRELKIIAKLVHLRLYQPGEYIFRKDQPGAAMFIIKTGVVNIVLPGPNEKEVHLATLKAGTFMGELALLDNSPRSASARAAETTEALAFFRSELNKLLTTNPTIGSKIMRKLALIIGQRLKATNEQLFRK